MAVHVHLSGTMYHSYAVWDHDLKIQLYTRTSLDPTPWCWSDWVRPNRMASPATHVPRGPCSPPQCARDSSHTICIWVNRNPIYVLVRSINVKYQNRNGLVSIHTCIYILFTIINKIKLFECKLRLKDNLDKGKRYDGTEKEYGKWKTFQF